MALQRFLENSSAHFTTPTLSLRSTPTLISLYSEDNILPKERPEMDQWILSELSRLIAQVDEAYNDYEPTKATRLITDFVQEILSNWYVRQSRRRFWKGEYEKDKIAAYQTLFECLLSVSKLMAPVAPFMQINCIVIFVQLPVLNSMHQYI